MASCQVDDEDLIIHTLNGFTFKYGPFETLMCTWSSPIGIEELHALLCEELSFDNAQTVAIDYSTSALLSSKDGGYGRSGISFSPSCGNSRTNYRGKAEERTIEDVAPCLSHSLLDLAAQNLRQILE